MTLNQDLALSIIAFLEQSVASKTVGDEFAESMDVAIDCIADAFGVDKADSAKASAKFGGKNLPDLVAASVTAPVAKVDADTKAKADALKAEGNGALAQKDFDLAVEKYTAALTLDPSNVVYLSNRAAAHSSALRHEKAVEDAEAAIKLDPSFAKAYSRLGLAQYALGNAKAAMEAYKRGLEVEGSSPLAAMSRGYETAKKRVEEELEGSLEKSEPAAAAGAAAPETGMPDLLLMFGGGMPNLLEMMNNPQVMQAAQNLMSNPAALQGLMLNPAVRLVAERMGAGGAGAGAGAGEGAGAGGNGLADLMNNPMLQDLARQFMGGQPPT